MPPAARQLSLFPDRVTRERVLPVLGEQGDIRYFAARARGVLNDPRTTGIDGFWSVNPYVGCAFGCAYCYARYAHRYALERALAGDPAHEELGRMARELPPWLAFERAIVVKRNAPEVLARTLRDGPERFRALTRGDQIVIGTATDPYQPAERRFRITRGILEALAQHLDLSVVIITKSPLVTRDVDVLARLARHSRVQVHVSLITVDRELARRLEPRAPTPEARLRAVRRLHEAGVRVRVNAMPVLPGITDGAEQLDALVRSVAAAGADAIVAGSLALRSTARQRYLPFIAQEFPALAARYRATYARAHTAPERYRAGLKARVRTLCEQYGLPYGSWDDDAPREMSAQARVTRPGYAPSRAARRSQ
ncbi:MAG: radical SAM protein [Gemmatimonadota bacterium]|nr:radical SAM protein [Gemmatimonadota bacterium]